MLAARQALVAVCVHLMVAGCQASPPSAPGRGRSQDTALLAALAPADSSSDTVVVLAYRPRDCFACYGNLARWLTWARANGGDVRIVLVGQPTPAEERVIAAYRIPIWRTLPAAPYGLAVLPTEVLYVGSLPIAHAAPTPGKPSELLSRFETSSSQ